METKYVKEIHSKSFKVYIIDDYELGCPKRTGTYVIHEAGDITLIDTCTSPSIRYILAGLNELKVELTQVKNIIVTHIHIDHAGAAGLLMKCCPNAKLFIHPEGTKFLCEPHKLEESLKIGFGNDIFNNQFAPLIPIDKARIHPVNNKEKLKISKERELQFIYTPGHANHHISVHDLATNGIFAGDAIGAYFHFPEFRIDLYLPITSPPQFDYKKMIQSKEIIVNLKPSKIYFGHYGASENVNEVYYQFDEWLQKFIAISTKVWKEENDVKQTNIIAAEQIYKEIKDNLTKKGLSLDDPFFENLKPDIDLCSNGIIRYLKKSMIIHSKFNVLRCTVNFVVLYIKIKGFASSLKNKHIKQRL